MPIRGGRTDLTPMRAGLPPSVNLLAVALTLLLLLAANVPASQGRWGFLSIRGGGVQQAHALPHLRERILQLKKEHQCGHDIASPEQQTPASREMARDEGIVRSTADAGGQELAKEKPVPNKSRLQRMGEKKDRNMKRARTARADAGSARNSTSETQTDTEESTTAFDVTLLPDGASLIASLPEDMGAVAASVKESVREAWEAYRAHAWGKDELVPKGCKWENAFGGQGMTIVDSMSTLLLLGLHEEYDEAANWVKNSLDYDKLLPSSISTFETSIRSLGGLMSAYESTLDCGILSKAKDLGSRILDTFSNVTSLHAGKMRLTGRPIESAHMSPRGLHAPASSLTEVGSFALEFLSAAYHSGDETYTRQLDRAMEAIEATRLDNGLYPIRFHSRTLEPASKVFSIGGHGDSFYEYLLKRWIHSEMVLGDEKDGDVGSTRYLRLWVSAMDSMIERMVRESQDGYVYVGDLKLHTGAASDADDDDNDDNDVVPKMEHLTCFVPGMLALGVHHARRLNVGDILDETKADTYMKVAKGVASTCFAMYATSGQKGLAPDVVYFNPKMGVGSHNRHYALRPEAIESFFYLHRITGDQKYRAYAYTIYNNIIKYHRSFDSSSESVCGFSVVDDVTDEPDPTPAPFVSMPSYFIAETLKYLYLIFSEDTELLPLDSIVMTTEGHPLTIKRRAAAVAAEACVPSEQAAEDVDGVDEARKAAAAEGDDGKDDESGKGDEREEKEELRGTPFVVRYD